MEKQDSLLFLIETLKGIARNPSFKELDEADAKSLERASNRLRNGLKLGPLDSTVSVYKRALLNRIESCTEEERLKIFQKMINILTNGTEMFVPANQSHLNGQWPDDN